jgi:hypothetical protein
MKNMLYGVLFSAFVFAALSWATTKRTVHAEVLTAPPAGRFELIQLHPSAGIEWSGILDTETGCTWAYVTSNPDETKAAESYKGYLQFLGQNNFQLVNFNPVEYTVLGINSDRTANFQPAIEEIGRVQRACSKARLQALSSAGGH